MNPLLKSALLELQRNGVRLDPVADLEHLLALSALAERVLSVPAPPEQAALLRPAAAAGNVTLHRLTFGAERFVHECVLQWDLDGALLLAALAYVHAHARDPERLWDCTAEPRHWWQWRNARAVFVRRVRRWMRDVTATPAELQQTLDELLDVGPGEPPVASRADEVKSDNYGWLIELLVREYGHDAEHWLWRVPADEIRLLMSARGDRIDRENRSRAASGRKAAAPDPDARYTRTLREFKAYVARVREEKRSAAPAAGDCALMHAPHK